jgi:transposase
MCCKNCGRSYTPAPARNGYQDEVRRRAVLLHLKGHSLRRVARALHVNHQSVANWARAYFRQPGAVGTAALLLDADDTLSLEELSKLVSSGG